MLKLLCFWLRREIYQKTSDKIKISKEKPNLKPLSITEQLVYQELFKNGDSNLLSNDYSFSSVFEKVSTCLENVIDKKIHDNNSKKMMNTILY